LGLTKDNKVGICCFSSKHAVLRSIRKDCLGKLTCSRHDIAEKLLRWR